MKLEAMGKRYEGSYWDKIFCNTSENSACWRNKFNTCSNAKNIVPMLELASITNYKQWGSVYVKK